MSNRLEKIAQKSATGGVLDEKNSVTHGNHHLDPLAQTETQAQATMKDLTVTDDDLLEAKELPATYSLDDVKRLMTHVHKIHKRDPNFPATIVNKIEEFLNHCRDKNRNRSAHKQLALRRSTCCSRQQGRPRLARVDDSIMAHRTVAQLLAYPIGTFMAKVLPDRGVTFFGVRHSLNPGPFNKKEHMLISIMSVAYDSAPYTNQIIWIQALPQYFDQRWAYSFGYQLCVALSTAFIGYGFAGMTRRFIVWPSHCIWPNSLATIALNSAFHSTDGGHPVLGPSNTTWRWSRIKFFMVAFAAMFVYFWFPNTIFGALSTFSWISWIAPNNRILTALTSSSTGLGLNPFPTFDWNIITTRVDPLYTPAFTTFNFCAGTFVSMFMVIGFWFSNAYGSAHLPINSNLPFDRFGKRYNVTRVLTEQGILDMDKYDAYSKPYISAGSMTFYFWFFAVYSASITYTVLQHRTEIWEGFAAAFRSKFRSNKSAREEAETLDVHMRHMRKYKEVPDWWFLIVLLISAAVGMMSMAVWPTGTSPAVVVFGLIMCAIFVIPIGIMYAMTGCQVTLNVLAAFIGGTVSNGNAVSMVYFKTYGYLTCAQAIAFAQDLKLGHYVKIPPRILFWAQMVPTFISTFIFIGLLQYQLHIDKICTQQAPFKFICPATNTFFTSAVLWGTVGPARQFGAGSTYSTLLVGFPIGIVIVLVFWGLGKWFPKSSVLRSVHPVVLISGALGWAPYNLTYIWPAVPVAAYSWLFVRRKYLAFWSRYNYVLSAAFAAGIAISAVVQFFGLAFTGVEINWWGNNVVGQGCEGVACPLMPLPKGEGFAPKPDGQY
ncbi:hypothetical protein LMH87_002165 [Akanthomyces muscarius]|uniref:Uncharacterized protein n=1 Tax=Akanthomyces muscarius TaxID=2231603 RepID=A0A9W8Q6K5_AKAMU|nr:hypothetical protein LMH87_002165 [Akanthomyces muscarius]KAJ4147657.1 hypothetical protein LMH87_002165 [Akanthomyces muscarius]